MKKRLFLPLLFVALGVFSFAPKSQNTQSVQAEGAATQTYLAKTLIHDVWANRQADVNKETFTFGVKHGYVGDGNIQPMTRVEGGSGGNMQGNAAILDWDGGRMNSGSKDSVILTFTAHTRITISISAPNEPSNDWPDNAYLNHYVLPVSYSLAKPTAITPTKTVSSFAANDFNETFELRTGETYIWEWGFQWSGSRNFNHGDAQLQFAVTPNDANTAELASLNLNLENVVKNPANTNGGKFIETGLANYGMTFGKILTQEFVTPTINGENYVVNGVGNAWWQLYAGLNTGFAFTFNA